MATNSSLLAWEYSMDKGAWQATAQGFTKSQKALGSVLTPPPHLVTMKHWPSY